MSNAIMMSPKEVAKVHGELARKDSKIHALSKKLASREGAKAGIEVLETVGAAALVGYARGKMEDKTTGKWVIPGTEIDMELALGVALAGTAFASETMGKFLGKYDQDAMRAGLGILAHYAGQIGRKTAETGTFSLSVAGSTMVSGHRRHVAGNVFAMVP
jgi:hypothetical protein